VMAAGQIGQRLCHTSPNTWRNSGWETSSGSFPILKSIQRPSIIGTGS